MLLDVVLSIGMWGLILWKVRTKNSLFLVYVLIKKKKKKGQSI